LETPSGEQPRVSGAGPVTVWPAVRASDRVRTSDVFVPEQGQVPALTDDLYAQGLRLVSWYSQRDGQAGKVLRVEPADVEPAALQQGLTWLYSELAASRAYYPGRAGVELRLTEEESRAQAWRALCALEARGVARAVGPPSSAAGEHPAVGRAAVGHAAVGRAGPRRWRVQLQSDGTLLVPSSCREFELDVVLEGFIGAYYFRWSEQTDGLAPDLVLLSRREGLRARVSTRVRIERSGGAVDELIVSDVSQRGVGIACRAAEQVIFPGQRLEGLKIHWKGGAAIRCDATVMHVSPLAASGYDRCGLVLHLQGDESARWGELVAPLLHPRTVLGGIPASTLFAAYESSGYLNLSGKRPEDFAEQQRLFAAAQGRLRAAPHLGSCVAAGDHQRLEAFCHQLQLWRGSWLFYHLCRLPRGRSLGTCDDRVLVDLYARAYAYVQDQPEARWLVTYIQKDAGYSHRVHYEGALDTRRLGGVAVVSVRVQELRALGASSQRVTTEQCSGATTEQCTSATTEQCEEVRLRLRRDYASEYLAATGLDEPGLGLGGLDQDYAAFELERSRQVLVVTRGQKILACAVLEAASPGLHLYGLLDCARVFVFERAGAGHVSELLARASAWYAARGRHRFCYFAEPDAAACPPELLQQDLGEAYVVVQPTTHVPLLLERVYSLAAPSLLGLADHPRESQEDAYATP
jgi:hypothetical protein